MAADGAVADPVPLGDPLGNAVAVVVGAGVVVALSAGVVEAVDVLGEVLGPA